MNPEQNTRLRAPFPAEHVGLLPKITCGQCSRASGRCCQEHKKSKCDACGNFITERHMHIDYVGHGAVTDRLLEVDPDWSWEPLAFDLAGMPTFIYDDRGNPVTFWIKLTVGGVTRLGVGSAPSGQDDAEKVLIGDALRNAAMRFGVALDLWIKGHGEDDERTTQGRASGRGRSTAAPAPVITSAAAKGRLLEQAGGDKDAAAAAWDKAGLKGRTTVTEPEMAAAENELRGLAWSWAQPQADQTSGGEGPAAATAGDGDGPPPDTTDPEGREPSALTPSGTDGPSGSVTLSKRDIAIRASEAFKAVGEAAPPRNKTRWLDRMRHALVYAETGGDATSTNDLNAAQLAAVYARLGDIVEGRITVQYDMADEAGVTFVSAAGPRTTVLWSELEAEAVPA